MTRNKFDTIVSALDALLDEERAALLAGDLETIGALLERKEDLIEGLSLLEEYEAGRLEALTGKLKRNQDLLDSALDGIRTVARRLAALRRVRGSIDTYDASGARRSIPVEIEGSVEKRA